MPPTVLERWKYLMSSGIWLRKFPGRVMKESIAAFILSICYTKGEKGKEEPTELFLHLVSMHSNLNATPQEFLA